MENQYSVYQWFMDGNYERVLAFAPPRQALETAVKLTQSVGGRIGTTIRVIITDGGDSINWEWKFGEGVVFPTPTDVPAHEQQTNE